MAILMWLRTIEKKIFRHARTVQVLIKNVSISSFFVKKQMEGNLAEGMLNHLLKTLI